MAIFNLFKKNNQGQNQPNNQDNKLSKSPKITGQQNQTGYKTPAQQHVVQNYPTNLQPGSNIKRSPSHNSFKNLSNSNYSNPPAQTTPPTNSNKTDQPKETNNKNSFISNNNLDQIQKNQPTQSQQNLNTRSSFVSQKKPVDNKKEMLDLMTHLTQRSNRVFVASQIKAKELKNNFIESEHLLYGLLTDSQTYQLFLELKIAPQTIEQELNKAYSQGNNNNPPLFSPRVKRIIENSLIVARKLGYEFISPEHILYALYEEGEGLGARILSKLGLKKEDLNKKITGKKEGFEKEEKEKKEQEKNVLKQFTIDLTEKAAQGLLDPVVERSEVIERTIHILSRRTKNNPALVGEAGVGKTAVVEGLAQKIIKKEVPETMMSKKILQLDLMSLLAGASHRGEFEERMKKLIEEIKNSQGQIILFIDEIHNLVGAGAGGEGSLDASNFLKPSLARGELQLIGATTLTEYRKYIEKDPALERRFQPILVPEPTEEQAIKMLKATKDKYEAFHRVRIPDEAIETAVKLSKRYVGDRFLPDKAVDLIDESASAVRLPLISLPEEIRSLEERLSQWQQEEKEAKKSGNRVKANILKGKIQDLLDQLKEKQEEYKNKKAQTTSYVTSEIIKDIISRWTGIPVSRITESETEKLSKLEEIMHQRLINQKIAVAAVAEAVRRGRAGLKSTKRPIGSFVFLGPTGVGKTELAKTLAEVLFGQEEAIIRFDMTEYMEKHEVAKLIGAPPGYVGYEEGGKLTEAVRRKPYTVVLFDEVEKAHPDIFNILLQILDDGRLTDNKGHVISFKNTVVICTSNIGTAVIQDEIIKNGQMDVQEPPMLSTYAFSPRGRELLTIGNKIFEKDIVPNGENKINWKSQSLLDYFSGQKIESEDQKQDDFDFPKQGFDNQTISSKGVEFIAKNDLLYYRTSTTNKIWKVISLIDYFKDSIVINALPDAPDQQLPTAKIDTQTFSPNEWEIISYKDRFWKRKENSNNWETGLLKDYFNNQKKLNEKDSFPLNYWDIHTFSPSGKEIIIVGENLWIKDENSQTWSKTTLKNYFADGFPLEKEIEEKRKIEEESGKNQYQKMKEKVMNELRKFFRPELINRFDEVIIFEPLKYRDMIKIAHLQMKGLKKLLEEQGIGLSWSQNCVKEIVRVGFDPIYGARPLRRAIQKLIENPISTLIINQQLKEGHHLVIDFNGENFLFNIEQYEIRPKTEAVQNLVKNYFCEKCGNNFQTLTLPNSTVICSRCSSKEVQEEINFKEEKLTKENKDEKKSFQIGNELKNAIQKDNYQVAGTNL